MLVVDSRGDEQRGTYIVHKSKRNIARLVTQLEKTEHADDLKGNSIFHIIVYQ